tara:strand:+ start:127 stop:324 length:198 start_codon:yes stop_codon:yes gene_type:complete
LISFDIELTLENFQTIKLWHELLFKDKEQTQRDIEVMTKISAIIISEKDREMELKRRFRRYGRPL